MDDVLKHTLDQHRLSQLTHFSPEQIQLLMDASELGTGALASALLPLAKDKAQASISNFAVGAIAIGGSGHWYLGANVEFVGMPLPLSVHAEQAAIGHAALFDEQYIERVVVSATPCGHCRQFMQELNQDDLLLAWPEHHFMLNEILPHAFGPTDLQQTYGLLNNPTANLTASTQSAAQHKPDTLTLAAWDQANASYAPYSHNRAGVALLLNDGQICQGLYLENAAFNPSLGPLQLALSQLYLQGYTPADIKRAVLVEADAQVQQAAYAALLLGSLCDTALETLVVKSEA
ncbi:cytidine deaminase [Oceanisphaera sp. W20_SRM_FM3]|uniref:cytidine deaminase n=1 Tax=Oceanisphaera sp. W20_SRM_FM3 TaxID=3240267 RepID=UPI003F99725E